MTFLVKENISLAPLTTLSIGGLARYFTEAATENTVLDALDFARQHDLPVFILGGGSNILVSDNGFPGLVLRIAIRHFSFAERSKTVIVRAGAGVNWDNLVADCVAKKLSGIECLSGIPGWVGGAPVQNIGAYGQEVGRVITRVKAYDLSTRSVVELSGVECMFNYRSSIFNTSARDRYVVLEVDFELSQSGKPECRYPDLVRYFESRSDSPSLQETRNAVQAIRASKAMLLVAGEPDSRSAGSFFKNPLVSAEQSVLLEENARNLGVLAPGSSLPHFDAENGVKIPAAWLIESAGFSKGFARGRVGLSSKHTLAIVNRGGACAKEVLTFAREIQERVEEAFGICLHTELAFVGIPKDVRERFGAFSPTIKSNEALI